jgi:hypothetical protein
VAAVRMKECCSDAVAFAGRSTDHARPSGNGLAELCLCFRLPSWYKSFRCCEAPVVEETCSLYIYDVRMH